MTGRHRHSSLAIEADARSREAFDNVLRCLALGQHEPTLAPVLTGCALWCAGVGIAIAGIGVTASVLHLAGYGDHQTA